MTEKQSEGEEGRAREREREQEEFESLKIPQQMYSLPHTQRKILKPCYVYEHIELIT